MRWRTPKRAEQEAEYREIRKTLIVHPCVRCGKPSEHIHHAAKREGGWLTLKRYLFPLCGSCHQWVEDNKAQAEKDGFMFRIRETCKEHVAKLSLGGIDVNVPVWMSNRRKK